jgi:NAD(P)-dependent dehydrogenase (short-subunit alcohol dehydrogenase family)
MKDVKGKVAVVTGAASGIGRGMAESFVAAGMKVVLSDIELRALEATTRALRDAGADVHAVHTDVSRAEQVDELAQQTLKKFGAVHDRTGHRSPHREHRVVGGTHPKQCFVRNH